MTSPGPSNKAILNAYRALLRAGLRAVQYSSPARYAVRDKLRHAFQPTPPSTTKPPYDTSFRPATLKPTVFPKTFDRQRIENTVEFLNTAARRMGTEHNVVKNLCMVEYWRGKSRSPRGLKPSDWDGLNITFDEYDTTVRMLNDSLGIELR